MVPVGHCGRTTSIDQRKANVGHWGFIFPSHLLVPLNQMLRNANEGPANLRAVVEKEAGRGPLGFTEGRGGMVELELLLLGADLE